MGQAKTMSTEAFVKPALRIVRQLPLFGELAVAKGSDEETIGSRIARLRREKGLTQAEVARELEVSQPVVSDYENDVIKLSGETIVQLAKVLGASADEILGLEKPARVARGAVKNRRLLRQLQSIDRLPKRDQEALARTIDAFLTKAQ
jgi:transcriptional regulator with XRE-family HTH domain